MTKASQTSHQIGPYSGPHALSKLDGRRREARLMRDTAAELTGHLGHEPNPIERRLIDRAAVLALRIALMDARAPDGTMTEKGAREYLAWSNSYVRTLRELSSHAAAPAKSVEQLLAELHGGAK